MAYLGTLWRNLERWDAKTSQNIIKNIKVWSTFVAVKHGSFSGGVIGSVIGAVCTVIAGALAWEGVQEQITEQQRANHIAEITLIRSDLDRLSKQKTALVAALKYWGGLATLKSSAEILEQGAIRDAYTSMFNEFYDQFNYMANETRKDFEKIIEDLPKEVRARTAISVIRVASAYSIKNKIGPFLVIKENFLREEAAESTSMIRSINDDLASIDSLVDSSEAKIRTLQ